MNPSRGAVTAARSLSRSFSTAIYRPHESLPTLPSSSGQIVHSTAPSSHLRARLIHTPPPRHAPAAAAVPQHASAQNTCHPSSQDSSSNPALSFPCLDAQEAKSALLSARSLQSGPEPSYTTGRHEAFTSRDLFLLDWGGVLPEYTIAYETWGTLNPDKSNAILLHTGLSASSHAHSTPANPKPGWWERFIGPGAPLDTDKYFIICTNVIGGCFGSTGPSSIDPSDGKRYATRFPILTMQDMVRAQFRLLDNLGINSLAASVGSSMGGMQSLAAGVLYPHRVRKIVSISGCARSHPYSIAMRHTQRQVLMMDPMWARGFYYDAIPPHSGMKLAREIATVTYRSGPEWEKRFGRKRADPSKAPALCPDFLIETYLDHAGEKFSLDYDPNSLLYVSKAMDLFDLGREHQESMKVRRAGNEERIASEGRHGGVITSDPAYSLTLPSKPYEEQPGASKSSLEDSTAEGVAAAAETAESTLCQPPADLVAGLSSLKNHPVLVMGVASDILFPAWQQREIADSLRAAGSKAVRHVELGEDVSMFGHDTFLLDLENVGGPVGRFLA
ncbi:homoserine O-acetyltransferase [Polytolypa hystricis UAMH7299]|uniref:Homoserine O-acetyltransferase n=1 Tax=Polytolypa hystricis (strain UAMH7299) TaxID=1447883 RepID=A0A2B7XDG6_POLH7|nr:homoserine O-acetyltransferase [Polytolypa hystricis UAMH7299]